jgi:hypothetical protein
MIGMMLKGKSSNCEMHPSNLVNALNPPLKCIITYYKTYGIFFLKKHVVQIMFLLQKGSKRKLIIM